jgi:hypothetical protein
LSSCLLYRNVKVKIYKTIILPVVMYGCKTWSLTPREEHRLRVFENRVLRRIFGPKRDKVTGECRKLHSEELHNLYLSPDFITQVKAGNARERREKCTRFWWESSKEGDHLEDQCVGGLDGIRMDLGENGLGGVDWIRLAQDRDQWRAGVSAEINLRVLAPRS